MPTWAEGRIDFFLTAYHAQHGLLKFPQLFLQGFCLLTAEALTAITVQRTFRRLERRTRLAMVTWHQIHNTSIVQGSPCVVVDLLWCPFDVKYILFSNVDIVIQEKRCQVTLKISAVLHHNSACNRVTSWIKEKKKCNNEFKTVTVDWTLYILLKTLDYCRPQRVYWHEHYTTQHSCISNI